MPEQTNELKRREIAGALGYTITVEAREYEDCTGFGDTETIMEYVIYDPNGKEVTYRYYGRPNRTEDDAWNVPGAVPDWPNDPGAAITLCLEIQRGLLVGGYGLPEIEISQDIAPLVVYVSIGIWEGASTEASATSEQRLAEAASNAALAALEATTSNED